METSAAGPLASEADEAVSAAGPLSSEAVFLAALASEAVFLAAGRPLASEAVSAAAGSSRRHGGFGTGAALGDISGHWKTVVAIFSGWSGGDCDGKW